MNIKPGLFTINDGKRYVGYTTGAHWNGWACPMFTLEEATQLMHDLNEIFDNTVEVMKYDEADDCFFCYDANMEGDYEDPRGEPFKAEEYVIDSTGEVITLYAVGAYSWIWDDILEDYAPTTVHPLSK